MSKDKIILVMGIIIVLLLGVIVFLGIKSSKNTNEMVVNNEAEAIEVKNVKDGFEKTYEISIENKTTSERKVKISWIDVENTFKTQSDLRYTISDVVGESQVPVAASPIYEITISPKEKKTYELKIYYKATSEVEKDSIFKAGISLSY